MIRSLDSLIEVWKVSSKHHFLNSGATKLELDDVEKKLGYKLPTALRELYSFSNGLELLGGNVQIYPLEEHERSLGLTTASEKLREWGWPIANEILMIGGNGSDDLYGIWIPLHLRKDDLDEKHFSDIRLWADPNIPYSFSDPYEQQLTLEDLKKLFYL